MKVAEYESLWWTTAKKHYEFSLSQLIAAENDSHDIDRPTATISSASRILRIEHQRRKVRLLSMLDEAIEVEYGEGSDTFKLVGLSGLMWWHDGIVPSEFHHA
ncbi:uncharacterized protein LOC108865994 isoform X2 [Pyrus x bretschneideri]|uniref:uncharacterized protein LOC108865994 isoform X2 n=1 Tax=Pyrus x bretschneideri TaxID=225117 RepID=UPI002030C84F|nr:uncharacterized protein LOC108865994 isoform X2 [Pyrus x bretschneideri]XP_048442830.1 uncharacterized protein LOC108865994 isoform X2 [Pyrus x bretschneideri]